MLKSRNGSPSYPLAEMWSAVRRDQNPQARRILFISHNATRTGAPLILLALIRWLKTNSDIEPVVLFREGGEHVNEFSQLCATYFWPERHMHGFRRFAIFPKILRFLLKYKLSQNKISLIYANTAVNGEILTWVRGFFSGQIITHIHELGLTVDFFGEKNWNQVVQASDEFAASSRAVLNFLISRGVAKENITLNPYFADMHGIPKQSLFTDRSGAPFVIGAAGTIEWRKGTDLFLQLAALFRRVYPKQQVQFLWIGGPTYGAEWEKIAYDLKQLKLTDYVKFTGAVSDPTGLFAQMDVFVLTSREEAFGMVALEAAMAGAPTVCFSGAGGMADFVSGGAGVAVPYLDLAEMAKQVSGLLKTHKKRVKMVRIAQKKIRENHLLEHFGQRFLGQVEPLLAKHRL